MPIGSSNCEYQVENRTVLIRTQAISLILEYSYTLQSVTRGCTSILYSTHSTSFVPPALFRHQTCFRQSRNHSTQLFLQSFGILACAVPIHEGHSQPRVSVGRRASWWKAELKVAFLVGLSELECTWTQLCSESIHFDFCEESKPWSHLGRLRSKAIPSGFSGCFY
jgi:hypothetical protein